MVAPSSSSLASGSGSVELLHNNSLNKSLAPAPPLTNKTNNNRRQRSKSSAASLPSVLGLGRAKLLNKSNSSNSLNGDDNTAPTSRSSTSLLTNNNNDQGHLSSLSDRLGLRFSPKKTKATLNKRVFAAAPFIQLDTGNEEEDESHSASHDDDDDHSHSISHRSMGQDINLLLDDSNDALFLAEQEQLEQNVKRVRDERATQEARREELQRGLGAHTERALARWEMRNEKGALISMKHVKRLELELSNMERTLQYLKQLEQDLVSPQVSEPPPEVPPPPPSLLVPMSPRSSSKTSVAHKVAVSPQQDDENEDEDEGSQSQSQGQQDAMSSSASSVQHLPESEHDSLDALYSSMSSLNMQTQLKHSVMDIDYELDRILNTHMDSSSHLQLSDDDLLDELARMATNKKQEEEPQEEPKEEEEEQAVENDKDKESLSKKRVEI